MSIAVIELRMGIVIDPVENTGHRMTGITIEQKIDTGPLRKRTKIRKILKDGHTINIRRVGDRIDPWETERGVDWATRKMLKDRLKKTLWTQDVHSVK